MSTGDWDPVSGRSPKDGVPFASIENPLLVVDHQNRPYMPKAKRADWGTPRWLFEWAQKQWAPEGFTLDAAATAENALCERFWTPEDNALAKRWTGRVWCNPPYGRGLEEWVCGGWHDVGLFKGAEVVVMLLPAKSTDTHWWHKWVIDLASEVVWIRGRVHFEGAEHPAPFPSCLVVYERSATYTRYSGVDIKDMRDGS